jgi:hypothetical protein
VPPTAVPVQAAPTTPPPPAAAPATAASPAASPVAANAGPPATQNPAAAAPTPFAAQVSAGGGLGNTRADMDAAYGQPVGETAQHLVVYRKNNFEYHVELTPDLNGRAAVIGEMPAQGGAPLPLEQAQAEAHRLLPSDAQPPNQTPEGNPQYVVERYTSQSLAQALPAEVFSPGGGQPGQFMIGYARDAQGRITRWVLGPGNDANALLAQAQ